MIKLHEGPQLVLNDDVLASVSEHPEIDLRMETDLSMVEPTV